MKSVVLLIGALCLGLTHCINIKDFLKSMTNKEGCKDQFCSRCLQGWIKNYQMGLPCVKTCADGFYKTHSPTTNQAVCRSCRSNCMECSDWLNCDLCGSGYSLMETAFRRCVTKCPANYISIATGRGKTCQLDISGCTDASCSECRPGLYHLQDWQTVQCVRHCPMGYYGSKVDSTLKCKKCLYNCERCSSDFTCDKCMMGYSIISDKNRSYCLKQ